MSTATAAAAASGAARAIPETPASVANMFEIPASLLKLLEKPPMSMFGPLVGEIDPSIDLPAQEGEQKTSSAVEEKIRNKILQQQQKGGNNNNNNNNTSSAKGEGEGETLHAEIIAQSLQKAIKGTAAEIMDPDSATPSHAIELILDACRLSSLGRGRPYPLGALPKLRKLILSNNRLSQDSCDLQSSLFAASPELREVQMDRNLLTTLPGISHSKLEMLNVAGNDLHFIDGCSLPKLEILDLSSNHHLALITLQKTKWMSLQTLDISRCEIDSLVPISTLTHLRNLVCHHNLLTTLGGIEPLTSLEFIDASSNKLKYSRIATQRSTNSASAALANPLHGCAQTLQELHLSDNNISSIHFLPVASGMKKLWRLVLSGNPLGGTSSSSSSSVVGDENNSKSGKLGNALLKGETGSGEDNDNNDDDIGDAAYGEDEAEPTTARSSASTNASSSSSATAAAGGGKTNKKPLGKTSFSSSSVLARRGNVTLPGTNTTTAGNNNNNNNFSNTASSRRLANSSTSTSKQQQQQQDASSIKKKQQQEKEKQQQQQPITNFGIAEKIAKMCPGIETLDLSKTGVVTSKSELLGVCQQLAKGCLYLRELELPLPEFVEKSQQQEEENFGEQQLGEGEEKRIPIVEGDDNELELVDMVVDTMKYVARFNGYVVRDETQITVVDEVQKQEKKAELNDRLEELESLEDIVDPHTMKMLREFTIEASSEKPFTFRNQMKLKEQEEKEKQQLRQQQQENNNNDTKRPASARLSSSSSSSSSAAAAASQDGGGGGGGSGRRSPENNDNNNYYEQRPQSAGGGKKKNYDSVKSTIPKPRPVVRVSAFQDRLDQRAQVERDSAKQEYEQLMKEINLSKHLIEDTLDRVSGNLEVLGIVEGATPVSPNSESRRKTSPFREVEKKRDAEKRKQELEDHLKEQERLKREGRMNTSSKKAGSGTSSSATLGQKIFESTKSENQVKNVPAPPVSRATQNNAKIAEKVMFENERLREDMAKQEIKSKTTVYPSSSKSAPVSFAPEGILRGGGGGSNSVTSNRSASSSVNNTPSPKRKSSSYSSSDDDDDNNDVYHNNNKKNMSNSQRPKRGAGEDDLLAFARAKLNQVSSSSGRVSASSSSGGQREKEEVAAETERPIEARVSKWSTEKKEPLAVRLERLAAQFGGGVETEKPKQEHLVQSPKQSPHSSPSPPHASRSSHTTTILKANSVSNVSSSSSSSSVPHNQQQQQQHNQQPTYQKPASQILQEEEQQQKKQQPSQHRPVSFSSGSLNVRRR